MMNLPIIIMNPFVCEDIHESNFMDVPFVKKIVSKSCDVTYYCVLINDQEEF